MLFVLVLIAIAGVLALCGVIYSLRNSLDSLRRQMHVVEARFAESGIRMSDVLETQVRVPEKWVNYDGIADEDLPMRTGVHISRNDEWLDHDRRS